MAVPRPFHSTKEQDISPTLLRKIASDIGMTVQQLLSKTEQIERNEKWTAVAESRLEEYDDDDQTAVFMDLRGDSKEFGQR